MTALHLLVLIPVVFSVGFLGGAMWVVWVHDRNNYFE
jgi:nitrate reductase NapE component